MRTRASVLLIGAIFLASCTQLSVVRVRLSDGQKAVWVRVEVAATPEARERGLMGRKALASDTGMLFLFPGPAARRSFWMKDTLVPLDIAFLRNGWVLEIRQMEPCRSGACPLTTSADPADAALEVRAGTFSAAGLGAGALMTAQGKLPTAE